MHIVKPGTGPIRAQALSEHVGMRALAIAGLQVAETLHLTFEDQDAIVVTRFDRREARSGAVARIHQEDLVQAFAVDPRRKYEADQGPGVRTISDLLRGAADRASVERFVGAVIADQVLGAPDAHGKDYGRLRWTEGAMSIGGERGFGDVERGNWEKFARAAGLSSEQVLDWVDELAAWIPPAFEQAANEVAAPDAGLPAGTVAENIAAVAEQTRRGLASTRRSC